MKILNKTLLLIGLTSSFITTATAENNPPVTYNKGKFSVHCYFASEAILFSEARDAVYYSKGTWLITDVDGTVYETNTQCISRRNK